MLCLIDYSFLFDALVYYIVSIHTLGYNSSVMLYRYSNAHSFSKRICASLCTIPYDAKMIPNLSVEARETLHRFIFRVICLYIYSLPWLHHNREFKADLLIWAKTCLIFLTKNLNLEEGDFLTESQIILENLKSDFRATEKKNYLENHSIANSHFLAAPDSVTALSSLTSESSCFAINELEMQSKEDVQCSYFHEVLNLQPIKSLLNSKDLLAAIQISVNEAFDHVRNFSRSFSIFVIRNKHKVNFYIYLLMRLQFIIIQRGQLVSSIPH
jgi:hypothetical protein